MLSGRYGRAMTPERWQENNLPSTGIPLKHVSCKQKNFLLTSLFYCQIIAISLAIGWRVIKERRGSPGSLLGDQQGSF